MEEGEREGSKDEGKGDWVRGKKHRYAVQNISNMESSTNKEESKREKQEEKRKVKEEQGKKE